MNLDKERERLSQAANLAWLRRDWKVPEMITVDLSNENYLREHFIHQCALIPQDLVGLEFSKATLEETRLYNGGVPAAFSSTWGSEGQVEYFRYGVENGVEPLIIKRYFHGVREGYKEISEEFRHFHRLYHDRKTDEYIKIDDAGNEEVVAVVKPKRIDIRLKEIRQFLAVKQMFLSIRFDFTEFSEHSLEDLGIDSDSGSDLQRDSDRLLCWTHYYGDYSSASRKSFSILMGKRLIKPLPKSKSGFGDFAEQGREYVEFIFDVDENGDGICHTCDPEKLNDFGKNPDAPFNLTPIHFSKQVLDKYYNEPGKYTVQDSRVSCASLWGMKIDNHAPDKVCVMFRDLCYLPYTEQLHWRVHNVLPEGGVSETFYGRNFEGLWMNSDQPDLLFKQHYELLQRACDECLGWQLLKSLGPGDTYHLKRIRVPAVDEESDFKDLVSDLTSVLIDKSLNEKRLKDLIPVAQRKEVKRGINLLESVLTSRSIAGSERHIRFLRSLWDLRTTRSSAHPEMRDDKRYERAAKHLDLDNLDRIAAFAKILEEAVAFLEFLTGVVHSGKLNDKNGDGS